MIESSEPAIYLRVRLKCLCCRDKVCQHDDVHTAHDVKSIESLVSLRGNIEVVIGYY